MNTRTLWSKHDVYVFCQSWQTADQRSKIERKPFAPVSPHSSLSFYLHTTIIFTYIRRLFLLTYLPQHSSKLKELCGNTFVNWRKNIPQIRVTSYAFIDVNNKIGLHTEKQRQIILINVIENRYFQVSM
jgi:hypothetical protein